ncbi:MAG: hypothetical protein Q4D30_11280 [Bacteroidales bacterium]|nr:hypothetical protein [Bacteroidales bacterium]
MDERNKIKRIALEKLDELLKESLMNYEQTGDEAFLKVAPSANYFSDEEYFEIESNITKINFSPDTFKKYCKYRGILP